MVFLSKALSLDRLDDYRKGTDCEDNEGYEFNSSTVYGTRWSAEPIPRYALPEKEMDARVAYRLIKDELALDGNPALNLATFVTTYMEEEAEKLMTENLSKNFIDYEEYPMSTEIQSRCVNIIARLFNAPLHDSQAEAVGVSTVGSSEAIILSVLAMKRLWQQQRKAEGKPCDKPNLILSAAIQVCWKKACEYLEVEERYVYCEDNVYTIIPEKAVELVDENTIGICAILGTTYTGHYEDVKMLNELLEKKNKETGLDVGIHVDAASGGFVAPFVCPELEWDFRLPLVRSINVSGHKYGLCYPGVGWNVWRESKYLPDSLVFHVNYLGSDQASFTLNFSKGASNIIAQYYVLVRLGRQGFTAIMHNLMAHAKYLAEKLEGCGHFRILNERDGRSVPLVAFNLKNKDVPFDEFDIAHRLRERGWIIPAYTMAPHLEEMKLLRIVIREDFSRQRADLLIKDIMSALKQLSKSDAKTIEAQRKARKNWALLRNATMLRRHENATGSNGIC